MNPSAPAALRPRSVFSVLVILVASTGVPTPFLTFVENDSPWSVVRAAFAGWDGPFGIANLVWIAAPFFLAPLITLAQLRWIASGRFSAGERIAVWATAALAALVAIETVYLAAAFSGLWMFQGLHYRPGAYCTAMAGAAMLVHVARVSVTALRAGNPTTTAEATL